MTAAFLELTLNEFQKLCIENSFYNHGGGLEGMKYVALGLNEEAGEVAGKVKKMERDSGGEFTPEVKAGLLKELGDVLFYAAEMADVMGVTLDDAANALFQKARERRERGTMHGSGDNR